MKKILKLSMFLIAGAVTLAGCQKEFEYKMADNGPEMTGLQCDEAVYMGANIRFSVNLSDKNFALSTLKAKVYYDDALVNEKTIRTKEVGLYEDVVTAPLLADAAEGDGVVEGIATVIFEAVNVGQGVTRDTVDVTVTRPYFETLTLHVDGKEYTMKRPEGKLYEYSVMDNFPAKAHGYITTPAVNDAGDVIRLGWDGTTLSYSREDLIPFSQNGPGVYEISANLKTLSAAPFGILTVPLGTDDGNKVLVMNLIQDAELVFPNISATTWDLDSDYFKLSKDGSTITFAAMTGRYKLAADKDAKFIKVEVVDDNDNTATLSAEGDGAVWVIGSGIGKPKIGPDWNTTDGAYCLSPVAPKVYQLTLVGGGTVSTSPSFKFFHQKGWGGEFVATDYVSVDLKEIFTMTDSGNIEKFQDDAIQVKQYYRFTLDLTDGVKKAKLSVEEIESPVVSKDIKINNVPAERITLSKYMAMGLELKKGQELTFSGEEDLTKYYIDPDWFTVKDGKCTLNTLDGIFTIILDVEKKGITAKKVLKKEDGGKVSYVDATLEDGALWMMAWGLAHPVMTSQFAFNPGEAYCMPQVEEGIYQLTGVAVEETDGTTLGGRFRYDYLSFKWFHQNGWGGEMKPANVTFDGNAKDLLAAPGNIELADVDNKKLEKGATYRLRIDLNDGKELVIFDKL